MISAWALILAIFFYFIFKWLFRILAIMFLAKIATKIKDQATEKLRGLTNANDPG